jgi:hypothetical protein
MNKSLFAVIAIISLTCSCGGNKTAKGDVETDSDTTVTEPTVIDTLEQLISETPMPKAADELFDDFFFNFAANKKLQMKRITFPLPVTSGGKTTAIDKNSWKTEHFFMRQDYYTLIFNGRKQMSVVKDTSVNHVIVERISLGKKSVRQYMFDRMNGLWTMHAINDEPLSQNANASFIDFYRHFATDTAYQVSHISDPVKFVGPDPDDEFSEMTGVLTADTWLAFAPQLPHKVIYNIIYGQPYKESNNRIFVIRGISNGLEMELVFKRTRGKWLLTEFNQ